MKKSMIVSVFLSSMIIFYSCNKKEDPAPGVNTTNTNSNNPPSNTPSTTAPSLNTAVVATIAAVTGTNNAAILDLSTLITEPQGDTWTVTSVSSTNPAVAKATVGTGTAPQNIQYTGVTAGSTTFSIVLTDAAGNTNTVYYTVNVTQDNNATSATAPSLNAGVPTVINVTTGVDNAETLNLSTLVTDPQGDVWTITSVTSTNPAVATASIKAGTSSQSIEYVGMTAGNTTLTLVLSDASGNTNTVTYSLTVIQAIVAPYLNSGVTTSLSVITGATNAATLDLTNSVTEPQGQGWYISSYSSSNTSVATVAIAPASDSKAIRYTGVTAGTTTLTLILNDLENNTQTVIFNLTVLTNSNGPTLDPGINTNLIIQEGSNAPWNLDGKVTDPNGLSWFVSSVSSSNTSIATVRIDGAKQIDYLGVAAGQATLSIVLVNSDGAEKTILVTVGVNSKGPKGGGVLPGGGGVIVGPGGGVIPK